MNQVVFVLLCVVLFGVTQSTGHGVGHLQRCLCRGRLLKVVRPACVHTVELFPPSATCSKTEIILNVTEKGRGNGRMIKVCLDPNEKQGQRLLKGKGLQNKKQKNRGRKGKNKKSDNKHD